MSLMIPLFDHKEGIRKPTFKRLEYVMFLFLFLSNLVKLVFFVTEDMELQRVTQSVTEGNFLLVLNTCLISEVIYNQSRLVPICSVDNHTIPMIFEHSFNLHSP